MRYLLIHHPAIIFLAAFMIVMALVRYLFAPAIVAHFGAAGTIATLIALFILGFILDRRH